MMGDYARSAAFPAPYLAGRPAGVWLLAASLLIAVGIWADLGSLMISVFVVPAGLYFHRSWTIDDPAQRQTQSMNFFRNVALLGRLVRDVWILRGDRWGAAIRALQLVLEGSPAHRGDHEEPHAYSIVESR
jgi:uncharacterized membrane protein YphA (DoxX/SURF4 family)